jgi:C4-dicarboxylate transporter DctM subunit
MLGLIGLLLVLMLIRVPVAISLILTSAIGILVEGINILSVVQRLYAGTVSWLLTAIPFFILAGTIMSEGGLSKRLVAFSDALVGWMPGGLATVNIVASMFFGGISGSAIADTSAIGSVLIPEMESHGYSRKFASAVTVASSPIGMIIPPSIPFVVWSFVSGISLGKMFLGGVFPGILVGVSLIIVSTIISIKRKFQPRSRKIDLAALKRTYKDGIIALVAPVIIIGGILTGIFTATESAIIAVLYSWIVTQFIYKEFKFSDFPRVLVKAGLTSASVMFIIGGATVFSWLLAINRVPQTLGLWVGQYVQSPGLFVLMGALLMLVLGMFLDTTTIILLIGPILAPIINTMNIDPILVALIFMIVLAAGLFTPPLGLCLFVVSSVADVRLEDVAVETIPFLIVMLLVALVIWIFPGIVTFLPSFVV